MSDLISRSEVLELLYKIFDKYRMSTDKNTSIGKSFGTDVFEEIRNIPISYSVDKVVEELEKSSKWVNETNEYCDDDGNDYIPLSKAIEIVKKGCVSDDVCEWKYNDSEYYFESSCENLHIFMSDGPKENEYEYCPYCGKKIKVVE